VCGITGILNHTGQRAEIREADLQRMVDSIRHRGPDGMGVWKSLDGRTGFGHARLSIVDLSPAGAQPMHSPSGRFHITYNGEVYNHIALRRRLEHLGHSFIGRSDTETLLHALMQWGLSALDKMEGMFAFCFYDDEEKKAWLVRDRIGVKPLYYAVQNGLFYFASEIKALVAHPAISAGIDPLACYHYLTFLTTPAPLTLFKGIWKIPAGHLIEVNFATEDRDAEIRGEQWWDAIVPPPDDDRYSDEEWVKGEVRRLLADSIEKRMMSDVPFGVFLSGGIDSSTNVALMDAVMTQPVKTFSVGFKNHPEYNELDYARKVSDLFKTEHHEVLIDSNDMMGYLDQLILTQDEPIADWVCIPLYFVSKLVRDAGTIVVQVGEGSDEQFFGYDGYMQTLDWRRKYWNPMMSMPGFARGGIYGLASFGNMFDNRWRGRKELSYRAWKNRELFWGGAICYPEIFKQEIVADRDRWEARVSGKGELDDPVGWLPKRFRELDSFGVVDEYLSTMRNFKPSAGFMERMVYLELKLRLVELLLMRVDKVTMSTSIEARVPYLDHRLVEFTMNIPDELKIKNGVTKYILKEAVRGLIPDEIIDRPKMGFGAPMSEWLEGDFGEKVESIFGSTALREEGLIDFDKGIALLREHRKKGRDYAYPVWCLFNLALWYDRWVARKGPSHTQAITVEAAS
jgi:asparagine synthase (glutamine-hydrolysing)